MRDFTIKEVVMAGYVVAYVLVGLAAGFGIAGLLFGVLPMLLVLWIMIESKPKKKKR